MAFADRSGSERASFDDVNLFEAENDSAGDSDSYVDSCVGVSAESLCAPNPGHPDQDLMRSKSDTDFISASDRIEDRNDIEAEISSLSSKVDESGDVDQNVATAAKSLPTSCSHSTSLSPEVDCRNVKALPPGHTTSGDSGLDTSTAMLSLDSDVDSPHRQQADCEYLTSGDELEVNVAALQRQIYQLTSERDEFKSLYAQAKDENENYQEQILEVRSH